MPIPVKASCVHVKLQSTLGTAATITVGTDPALRVIGTPTREQIGEGQIARTDQSGSRGGPINSRLGSLGWRFTFSTEFFGPQAVNDPTTNPLWPLMAASMICDQAAGATGDQDWWAGLMPVPTASGSLALDGTSQIGVVTVAFDELGGNRYMLYDGTAKWTMSGTAGQAITVDWVVEGKWVAPAASVVTAGSEAYDPGDEFDLTPWLFCGATLALGLSAGTPTGLTEFLYDPGIEHVTRFVAGADGASCMAISQLDRAAAGPTLAVTIDADDETSLTVWTEWLSGETETRGLTITAPSTSDIDSAYLKMVSAAIIAAPKMGGDTYRTYDLVITGTTAGGNVPSVVTFTSS